MAESTTNEFFGWNLLYNGIKNEIKNNADILIALTHWYLVKNYSFSCVGIGDDKTLRENEIGNESLPDGWNSNDQTYSLRYVSNKKLYILMGTRSYDTLIMNLLNPVKNDVSNLCVNVKESVKTYNEDISKMIPNVKGLLERIKRELVEEVFEKDKRSVNTQTQNNREQNIQNSPLYVEPNRPLMINPPIRDINPFPGLPNPLRDIGRGDLDPLSGGGGMILPFPRHGGFDVRPFPSGGNLIRPPGARFDPFGPNVPDGNFEFDPNNPNNRINRDPNPDHLRPGSAFDDMYS